MPTTPSKTARHDDPPFDQPCCFNCVSFIWSVGVGLGMRCGNPANRENPDLILKPKTLPRLVPSRRYVCALFRSKRTGVEQWGPEGTHAPKAFYRLFEPGAEPCSLIDAGQPCFGHV